MDYTEILKKVFNDGRKHVWDNYDKPEYQDFDEWLLKNKKLVENLTKQPNKILKDWQKWEDCISSFLRTHKGLRSKFDKHVEIWNIDSKLPPSAYDRCKKDEFEDCK